NSHWWILALGGPSLDSLLNVCMDAKHNKTEPGPEGQLYGQCLLCKDNACCIASTGLETHTSATSSRTCLYECSPNLGPWIDQVGTPAGRRSGSRMCHCARRTEQWWEDCWDAVSSGKHWLGSWDSLNPAVDTHGAIPAAEMPLSPRCNVTI
uniref:Folate receptor-like domain-containing protein n=1 Tax=Cyanistes caeruleus TaxID=156563 RepID=A0A8C0V695_CYACU